MPRCCRAISLFVVGLCLAISPCFAHTERAKPKLILAIIVDQFRYDYLLRFKHSYQGGIGKLLKHGAVFADAHYPQYPTVTAVGHSTFLSGATPSVSGIINNEWFERTPSKGKVTSVADATTYLVRGDDKDAVNKEPGSSPRRLLVSTIGDELKIASHDSKVIGISLKDRGAILASGHMADAAYWFYKDLVVTSTYYRPELPDWIVEFNKKVPERVKKFKWYPVESPNGQPFCTIEPDAAIRSCGEVLEKKERGKLENTPLANELLEELAEKVITHEGLGTRTATDILTISFSANDYVGHELGPDSPEVRDISIRTDQLLMRLFDFLERSGFGGDKSLIVFTADHGVAATPKLNNSRKMPGGYIYSTDIEAQMNERLSVHFRKWSADWVRSLDNGFLYLNHEVITTFELDAAEVRRVAAEVARETRHVARVFNRDDMLRGTVGGDHVARAVQLGFYGPRSGDLILVPEPNFMFAPKRGKYDTGTTHSTPYTYDTHVPVIFFSPGIIRSGINYGRISVNDVAPTLAAILGIEAPSGSSGRVLSEILE